MGQVDLDFKPSVPVFDANVCVGRRHDKRVAVDTVEGTLAAMRRAGIGRALVYSPHATYWDPEEGNEILLETVAGHPNLAPQFVGRERARSTTWTGSPARWRTTASARCGCCRRSTSTRSGTGP